MTRPRAKTTSPAKKATKGRAGERANARNERRPNAPGKKRSAANVVAAPRKPAAPRVPRSTKRSATAETSAAPAKRRDARGGALAAETVRTTKRRAGRAKPRVARADHVLASNDAIADGTARALRIDAADVRDFRRDARELERADTADTSRGVVAGSSEHSSARTDREHTSPGRVMELHWGDEVPSSRRTKSIVERWITRGDALLRHLAEHGAARHEYRADLKDGRFVWVDVDGRVSVEAHAKVLCSWSRTTSALSMAWADPIVRAVGIARIEGMTGELDDVDEESAWRVAMEAADAAHAEYLYRVTTPHAWYFLALSRLTFHPERASFHPSTPVGLVLRGLADTRRAVESRAEPADVVRARLAGLGQALVQEAEYAYRLTDWVARLQRTGRRLVHLADQLPCASFKTVAAGHDTDEWLSRDTTIDVSEALSLLEDEWTLFADR